MKYAMTADLHLSAYNNDQIVGEKNLPERLYFIITALQNILSDCKERQINKMIIAGDIYHDKSILHSLAQDVFLDFIRNNRDFEFIIIDGNHDKSSMSKSTNISALKNADMEPNVITVHETKIIDNIAFVPWGSTMIEDVKNSTQDYLISHFGVNEAELSNGLSLTADIKMSDLKKYKKVILGHYHKPQNLGNMWYCGSPIALDWNDKNQEKRYLILDTENDTIESIPTRGYKKYYELMIDSENKDEIIKEVKRLKNEGHAVTIKKFSKEINTDDIQKEIRVIDLSEQELTNRGIDRSMSLKDKLMKYVEVKEIPEDKREYYVDIALQIIGE